MGERKIFLSYCQKDSDIADLIEERLTPLVGEDYTISRDIRNVEYGHSFRNFMESIREHEYVIMVLSDRYLKSINCMYEMLETFKDSCYGKRLLFIILSDEDKKYFKMPVEESIAADLYSIEGQTKYILFWQQEKADTEKLIHQIGDQVLALPHIKRLREITKIELGLSEFFEYISDARGLPLKEHLDTDFREILERTGKVS